MICNHTYVRWVDDVATCAVCSEKFPSITYNPKFVGTFPRVDLETVVIGIYTTMTSSPRYILTIDE